MPRPVDLPTVATSEQAAAVMASSSGVMGRLLDRAEDAYRAVRPMIDSYPDGLPHRAELPERARALLDDLDRADAAVKRHREQTREAVNKPSATAAAATQ